MIKKTAIIKFLLFLIFLAFYTYVVIFFVSTKTLKAVSIGNLFEYGTMEMLLENNKSVQSFIKSHIKSDIELSKANYPIFSNSMEFYYIFIGLADKKRLCKTILKDSNNTDIKEFLEKHCENEK